MSALKYSVLLILLLLLLMGCKEAPPAETAEEDFEQVQVVEEPEAPVEEPADVPAQPTPEEQMLIDSELEEFDPGLVYRYVGESLRFQPVGWNVGLELPQEWKDRVSVFCTHPNGEGLAIFVVPNALIEAYMEGLNRPANCSYYDYCLRLTCQPKETGAETRSETAVKIHEDETIAYYLDTNLSRSPECQESQLQELLIGAIGEQRYLEATDGFRLTAEEAAKMFVFAEG